MNTKINLPTTTHDFSNNKSVMEMSMILTGLCTVNRDIESKSNCSIDIWKIKVL